MTNQLKLAEEFRDREIRVKSSLAKDSIDVHVEEEEVEECAFTHARIVMRRAHSMTAHDVDYSDLVQFSIWPSHLYLFLKSLLRF